MTARFEFTKDAVHQIRQMRKDGRSLREIAMAIGCSRATLNEQDFNLGSLRRRFTNEEVQRMASMRKRGCTLQEIAIALDCSQNAVSNHIRNLDPIPALETRPIKPKRPVPNPTRRRVIALRKRGYSYEKIANIVALAPSKVRSIVLTGGRPTSRQRPRHWERIPEDKVVRIIALRRAGSSLYRIAEITGASVSATMMILRRNGFPGKIRLLRMAGPVGSRVRGICRAKGCEGPTLWFRTLLEARQ